MGRGGLICVDEIGSRFVQVSKSRAGKGTEHRTSHDLVLVYFVIERGLANQCYRHLHVFAI